MNFRHHCKNCNRYAHCCIFKNKSGFAFVGLNDAKKIKKFIKKDYNYFLDYSPFPKSVVKRLREGDPSLEGALRYKQLDKNRLLRLKSKKDKRCIFLDKNNCCEIYAVTPNICRIYPFWAMKLINGRIKILMHGTGAKCNALKVIKNGKDVEQGLSKKEILDLKKVFRKIVNENKDYVKNIKLFVRQNKINRG
jgi:Fe-S-cluster containining protein